MGSVTANSETGVASQELLRIFVETHLKFLALRLIGSDRQVEGWCLVCEALGIQNSFAWVSRVRMHVHIDFESVHTRCHVKKGARQGGCSFQIGGFLLSKYLLESPFYEALEPLLRTLLRTFPLKLTARHLVRTLLRTFEKALSRILLRIIKLMFHGSAGYGGCMQHSMS